MGALNLKNSHLLYIACIGVVCGVTQGFLYPIDGVGVIYCFLGVILLLLFLVGRSRNILLSVGIFLCAVSGGLYRHAAVEESLSRDKVIPFFGQKVILRGVINDEPDERENVTQLRVAVSVAGDGVGIITPGPFAVLVSTERYPKFRYGDEIRIEGVLKEASIIESDTGRRFDYGTYLKKDGVVAIISFPKIYLVNHEKGSAVHTSLFRVKEVFLEHLSNVIKEPESSLLAGLLVGEKQSLGKETLEEFRRAGLVHVVVLSGYNLTLVGEAMGKLLSFLPGKLPLLGGGLGIVLFAVMVGGSSTVVRASIMAILALLAKATGRPQDVARLLFFTGTAMILYNPYILLYDPSFQLSFMATAGLIYLSQFFERWLNFLPTRFGIRELASATFATQLFVLPLLLYQTGAISLLSLPANFLVLPTVSFAMLFGATSGALSFVHVFLAWPAASLTQLILSYELGVAKLVARLPFAVAEVYSFNLAFLLASYVFIFSWTALLYRRKGKSIKEFPRGQIASPLPPS